MALVPKVNKMDLNNLTDTEKLFADGLSASGVPVTEGDIKNHLQVLADDAHLEIANPSKYSAFWCFCDRAITAPAIWLIAFMIKAVIPELYVKTATGSMLDTLAWAYDLTRKPAVKTQGYITFIRDNVLGEMVIMAGTIVATISINKTIYRMITIDEAIIPAGENTITILAEAEDVGANYNLGTAYYSNLESIMPNIESVTNLEDWLTLPGAEAETDYELRLRVRNHFAAVGDWHTDAKYSAMIAQHTGFSIDRIFYDHNIPRGPGSADAYILFDAGTTPTPYLESVNEFIVENGNHGHGDDMQVKALPTVDTDISVEIYFYRNTSLEKQSAVLAEIRNFIHCAFRNNNDYECTQTLPFSIFSFSLLTHEIHEKFPETYRIHWGQNDLINNLFIPKLINLEVDNVTQ